METAKTRIEASRLRKGYKRGFTLIEISVIITVIALFAALIMPNIYKSKEAQEARQFFPAARNMMLNARSKSIGDGQPRTVRLDDGSGRLIVEQTNDAGEATEEQALRLPTGVTAAAFRVEKNDSNSSDWKVGFYSDGKSEGGAIEFSKDGRAETIVVDPAGSVKILEGNLPDVSASDWDAGGYEQRIQ